MKISKKQHKEVIQSLLNRLHSAAELNRVAAEAHCEEAGGYEEDTLGYYTAMVDSGRAYDQNERFHSAMDVVIQVTGIYLEVKGGREGVRNETK